MAFAAMQHFAKQVVSSAVEWSGLANRKIDRLVDAENRLLVVMYHRVIDDPAADPFRLGMCVSRVTFESQIAWFRQNFQFVALDAAMRRVAQGETLPRRSLAITFDDGYRDNLHIAAPILLRYGAPATFYVVTGGIEEGRSLWWDRVIAIAAGARVTQVDSVALGLPGVARSLSFSALWRRASLHTLLSAMWELAPPDIDRVIERFHSRLDPMIDENLAAPRMTPSEVAQLATSGFAIGAHTVHHADPKTLSPMQLRDELVGSRRTEPPRISRRLYRLREWSHEEVPEVLAGSA